MSPRRELAAFAVVLVGLILGLLRDSLLGGKVLSPADVLLVTSSFRDVEGASDEPWNRLLIDPVLQFQPWLELNRAAFREGRLPLWNPFAGCGAPHLANAQSAPFDPFQWIGYLGSFPSALAWMAAARLGMAGLGMFLLARHWGLGPWGRWFSGLTFPLSGFLIVWLLFPVTNVAVWMPWILLTGSRLLDRWDLGRVGQHAMTVGAALLGGHIQTSAHVLLASGCHAAWRLGRSRLPRDSHATGLREVTGWILATALGIGIGSIVILPLGVYLTKSPVWADRLRDSEPAWQVTPPRLLDSACTAVPYLFGSQRRGHPHLAKAFGVHNLNESAGGYAGLANLLGLVPLAWFTRRSEPLVRFLGGLAGIGFLGAFGFPPVANLLRAIPVIDVIDPRRLTLWVAFGLVLLGGIGLDRLVAGVDLASGRFRTRFLAVAGVLLISLAPTIRLARPWLESRSRAHYARAARAEAPREAGLYRIRADRQVRNTLAFFPRLMALTGLELLVLSGLVAGMARGWVSPRAGGASLLGLTLLELFGFADGMNPAIDPSLDRPVPPVVLRLRERLGPGQRVIGIGEEFPPNVAMRYGLSDARNYDSVELARSLAWFRPLYEPGEEPLSSRATITWEGVARALDRLEASGVGAVVSSVPPPSSLDRSSEPVGSAWVTWLEPSPMVTLEPPDAGRASVSKHRPGSITIAAELSRPATLIVRETYDEGWSATAEGHALTLRPGLGVFLSTALTPGMETVVLFYDPREARLGVRISVACLLLAGGAIVARKPARLRPFPLRGLGAAETARLESLPRPSPGHRSGTFPEGRDADGPLHV